MPEKEVHRKENKGGGGGCGGEIERRPQIWKFNHTQTSILAKCFLRDWNKATKWRFPFITCTLKGGWSKQWWLHVENCVKYFISFLWFVFKKNLPPSMSLGKGWEVVIYIPQHRHKGFHFLHNFLYSLNIKYVKKNVVTCSFFMRVGQKKKKGFIMKQAHDINILP